MIAIEFQKLNQAIKAAGSIMMSYFGQQLQLTHKSTSADYRTKADVETENAIILAIEKLFPDYNIFGEERGEIDKSSPYTFIIDPLDGTNNFVLGVPVFTSSVALMKNNEVIYGVVHCPITNDTYYALKGHGAFLNDNPISVNDEPRQQHATVSYFCNYVTPQERILNFNTKLRMLGIRRCLDLWSPAFCYCGLACGRTEGIINDHIELYDFAAGKLIATEAGAKVTTFTGESFDNDHHDTFVLTNGTPLHELLLDITKTITL